MLIEAPFSDGGSEGFLGSGSSLEGYLVLGNHMAMAISLRQPDLTTLLHVLKLLDQQVDAWFVALDKLLEVGIPGLYRTGCLH